MNKYDTFIESLTKNFSEILNLQLLQEEGPGKTLFNGIVKRIAELNSIKALYINYYIPSALKATDDDAKEIAASKYKTMIPLTEKDLKENYFETVRFGYVAAYHKYEIFISELLLNAGRQFSETFANKVPLDKYIEKKFNFNINDPSYSVNLHKINYICNCTKHYDGYPRKTKKPEYFQSFSEDEKLEFTETDLCNDVEFLLNHFNTLVRTLLILSTHQMLHESLLIDLEEMPCGPDKDKIIENKTIVDTNAKLLVESLKKI